MTLPIADLNRGGTKPRVRPVISAILINRQVNFRQNRFSEVNCYDKYSSSRASPSLIEASASSASA
jgi:hypothetical protein